MIQRFPINSLPPILINVLHQGSVLLLLLLLSRFSRVRLCDPIDGSPPGSPVPGILQARTLEWVAISFSNTWKWKVKGKSLSRIQLLATPWTAAHQAPPSMGFSRQEYWSGVPLPSPKGSVFFTKVESTLTNHHHLKWIICVISLLALYSLWFDKLKWLLSTIIVSYTVFSAPKIFCPLSIHPSLLLISGNHLIFTISIVAPFLGCCVVGIIHSKVPLGWLLSLACVLSRFSRVWLCAMLWTLALQAPVSMGFSRQEYWSRLPCLLQGIFLTQGSNLCLLCLLHWQAGSLPSSVTWKPLLSLGCIPLSVYHAFLTNNFF